MTDATDRRPLDGRSRGILLYGVFLYATFAPTFRPVLGTAGAIIVNGGLLVITGWTLLVHRFSVPFIDPREKIAVGVVGAALVYYVFAIAAGSLFLSDIVIFRDTYELHKPILYMLALLLPFLLVREPADIRRMEGVLLTMFCGIMVLGVLQYTGLAPVGELYTKPINVRAGRLTVPYWNPYDFGFAVSFFLYYFLFRHLRQPGVGSIFAAVVALVAVVLSQSRTSVATVAGAIVILVPLALVLDRHRSLARLRLPLVFVRYAAYGAAFVMLAALAYIALAEELRYLIYGFEQLVLEGEQSSLNIRIRQLAITLDAAKTSPLIALFGNGISKGTGQMVESGYGHYLFRFGFVGLLMIFLLPLLFIVLFLARTLLRTDAPGKDIAAATFVWMASLVVASIGNNFTEQFRISFYYYFLFGFAIRYYHLARQSTPDRRDLPIAHVQPRPLVHHG